MASSSISARSRWVAGSGTASRRFSSLAVASNRMISPSCPRRNFSLSLGLAVLVIHGTELAVGGDRRPVATLGQFLIAGDPMFGQEVQRFCGSLQILDGCPVFVASALLSFEIVLDSKVIFGCAYGHILA